MEGYDFSDAFIDLDALGNEDLSADQKDWACFRLSKFMRYLEDSARRVAEAVEVQ